MDRLVGGDHGFPEDLCSAGFGGFTGRSRSFPEWDLEVFDLAPFVNRDPYRYPRLAEIAERLLRRFEPMQLRFSKQGGCWELFRPIETERL